MKRKTKNICKNVYNQLKVLEDTRKRSNPQTSVRLYKAGADPGGPYYWQNEFYFFTLYIMSEKIFLKLNFDFIMPKSEEFLEVWGCMRVCVSV